MKRILFLAIVLFSTVNLYAQTIIQNSGWLALINNTKISDKWGVALDVQFRSADNWSYVRNVLVRPGVTYFINPHSNVTVGYLNATTYNKAAGISGNTQTEQRVWEQYIYNHKLKSFFVTHRGRLEQRFIEQINGDEIFAQRFRYFLRLVLPLQREADGFTSGPFIALQNEVFLNVQNKELLNDSVFDQNRSYLAGGYRFSKKVDLEAGYLKQYSNGVSLNSSNRVVQLALYTRF